MWLVLGPVIAVTLLLAVQRGWFGLKEKDLEFTRDRERAATPRKDAVLVVGAAVVSLVALWLLYGEE